MEWYVTQLLGTQYYANPSGTAASLTNRAGHRTEFFAGESTLILGKDMSTGVPSERTKVQWRIPTIAHQPTIFVEPYLVVACSRFHGGLHSLIYDSDAIVTLNDHPVDKINLRIKPTESSDYFQRISLPAGLPALLPFNHCQSVHAWSLMRHHLQSAAYQDLTLDIAPGVNWDVDYVGIVYLAPQHRRFFLSYNQADRSIALKMRDVLANSGIHAWIDVAEIHGGDSIIERIELAMNTVDFVVAVLSVNSVASRWVKTELEIAHGREINGKKMKVIPAILDNCQIPLFLSGKKYIDMRTGQRYRRFLLDIKTILAAESSSRPAT